MFQFDLDGEKLVWHPVDSHEQGWLYAPEEGLSVRELARKLDRKCRFDDVDQPVMLEFCRRCVQGLMDRDGVELSDLFLGKDVLERCIREKIVRLREEARKRGFQQPFAVASHVWKFPLMPLFPFRDTVMPKVSRPMPGHTGSRKHYYDRPR